MPFSDYLENELLDHVFGNASYSAPATLYVGLSTTAISSDGTGITEPSGNNYSRVAVTNNSTNFPAASASLKSNGTKFTFAAPSGSWGTISHAFISDASSSGNMLGYSSLTSARVIDATTIPVEFDIGNLQIRFTN